MRRIVFYPRLALGTAIFWVGAMTLGPVLMLCASLFREKNTKQRDWLQKTIHQIFKLYSLILVLLGVAKIDFKEQQQLKDFKGGLVISNHPTLIDVIILLGILPQATCIVKKEVWNNIFFGKVVQAAGYITNTDSYEFLDRCSDVIHSGGTLLIFPEGTRSQPNQKIVFQRGVSALALICQGKILPLVLDCQPPSLLKGQKWYEIPPRRMHFEITINPIISTKARDDGSKRFKTSRELNHFLEHFYQEKIYGHANT